MCGVKSPGLWEFVRQQLMGNSGGKQEELHGWAGARLEGSCHAAVQRDVLPSSGLGLGGGALG